MTDKDIQFQMDLLWRAGYHAAARIIETLQTTISRKVEMDYLKTFVQQGCFSENSAGTSCTACGRHTASTIILMWIRPGTMRT